MKSLTPKAYYLGKHWVTASMGQYGISRVDNLKQDLDVVKPAIKFYVIPESTNPNVDPITTCTVGDYLQLEIEMQIISHTGTCTCADPESVVSGGGGSKFGNFFFFFT